MKTVREMADQFQEQRKQAWSKTDPTTAVVAVEKLSPEDELLVRQIVTAEGHQGLELEETIRKVESMIVGQVEAMADDMPADGGD